MSGALGNKPQNPYIETASGDAPLVLYGLLEANSQTFKAGELVYVTGGAVAVAVTGDYPVLGIALKDATNVTSGNVEIPVAVFREDDIIVMQVRGSGTLEAADTTCAKLTAYDVAVSSNLWYVESSDTTNPVMVFLQAVKDVNGDSTYWGKFRIIAAERQLTSLS